MKRHILTIALLAAFLPGLHAQADTTQAAPSLRLSLAEAKRYAVEHNRQLMNADLSVRQAEAQRWQAIASMLPQASANLNYTNMCGYSMEFPNTGMAMDMPPYGQLGITVSAAVNGQTIMGAVISKMAVEMQDISQQQTEQQIQANVTQTYTGVLALREVCDLLRESLKNVEAMRDMAQRAADVGTVEQTAADQIQVRVATLQNSINSTLRNAELSANSLRLLLGVGNKATIELTDRLDDLLDAGHTLSLLGTDFDINRNFNYQLLEKNTELSKKQVTMAWMAYTPTLSVAYQYAKQKYFSDTKGFSMTPPNTVTAQLSVPLFSSLSRAAGVKEKRLAYKAALNTMEDTRDQLLVQNEQLRFNLNNAYETYATEKQSIDVTKRVFESTTNKYQHGVASTQDLITASNDLITAQNTYVQAVLTLVQAQTDLEVFLNK